MNSTASGNGFDEKPSATVSTGSVFCDYLLQEGFAPRTAGFEIARLARQWGCAPERVLLATGHIRTRAFCRAYARFTGLPFDDLESTGHGPFEASDSEISHFIAENCLPMGNGQGAGYAIAPPPDCGSLPVTGNFLRKIPRGGPLRITTPRDLHKNIISRFRSHLSERAIGLLKRRRPDLSAATGLAPWQKLGMLLIIGGLAGLVFMPVAVLLLFAAMVSVFFAGLIGLRLLIVFIDWTRPVARDAGSKPSGNSIADHELPVYTVLVPVFHESSVLVQLFDALKKIDYPPPKLDIKILFEEEDTATLALAKTLDAPAHMDFIVVPKSEPQTKPKALNFALSFARGRFITIFDAEDIPAPGQLRAALEVFRRGPDNLACVQAHLGFYNGRQNWLTRQFTLEYAGLFHVQLPILTRLGLPIMLGGTSNHFRTDILLKIGGWDPYNVTEDADLGIRLERLGYQCDIVDSCTGEEANSRLGNWIRQRSRWLKGWMQTYAVHMRHPAALFRDMGLRKFLAFQAMTAGMIISALAHPFFLAYLLYSIGTGQVFDVIDYTGGSTILTLAGFNLVMGYVSAGLLAARGSRRSRTTYLMADVLFIPVYWLLISLASYKALGQFFTRRSYWEKTEHGLDAGTRA